MTNCFFTCWYWCKNWRWKWPAVYRLKELVPSVCVKDNVSQLDVILEAIRYIASLQVSLFLLSDIIFFWYVDIFLFCLQISFPFVWGYIRFCLPLTPSNQHSLTAGSVGWQDRIWGGGAADGAHDLHQQQRGQEGGGGEGGGGGEQLILPSSFELQVIQHQPLP